MKIRWASEARRDRRELINYVAETSVAMALELDDRVSSGVSRLADFPYSGRPGREAGTRELIVLRTPYIAVYTVDDSGVRVVRLVHGAQRWPEEEA